MKHMKPFVLAITLLLFLTAFPAMATMVYSGKLDLVGPDFNIDINKDGSSDFTTGWRTWAFGNGFSQSGYDAAMNFDIRFLNSELAGFGGYPGAKAPLDYGQLIGPTPPTGLLWSFNSNDSMLWTTIDMWNDPSVVHGGIWNNQKNKYLGFELNSGLDSYYGWIRLNANALNEVTLVDYAYENVPGRAISAGIAPIPEPSSLYLLSAGFVMILFRTLHCRGRLRRP